MGQAQINVRTRACSRTSIARTRQAALTHNVRGKELRTLLLCPERSFYHINASLFGGHLLNADTIHLADSITRSANIILFYPFIGSKTYFASNERHHWDR